MSSGESDSPQDPATSIDGYDLIEQIGSGGMGVVYRARQIAADRLVALKLIRGDRLQHVSDSKRRQLLDRFRVEAQATARLDHPHVVGIFEVNISDPDTPWFSMQLVEGTTLADRLKDGPVDGRQAANYTAQISSAIAAAHARQVLHRDLKPHNVFLRTHEENVLVGDFGLAKLAQDDTGQTSHDNILGTPAYMSPEQIRNASVVGPATDIWSIGATMYHLLTGRPPFQAATAMETLFHILDYEPTAPRLLNPSVDRDLETICLKCLQKDISRRYASASDLHEDLTRYLSGEPIKARPLSRAEHMTRWCRRNPVTAVFAGSALLALLAAVVSLWIGYQTAADALADSRTSHQFARQTVHDLLTEVSETVLLDKPGLQPLRRQLYERSLSYYRKFVALGHNSAELREETADVWYKIGQLEKELGNLQQAGTALHKAMSDQIALVDAQPSMARRQSLSSTWNALGTVHIASQEWDQTADALRQALEIRESLHGEDPQNSDLSRLVASTQMNLGAVSRNVGHLDDALSAFRRAESLLRQILNHADLSAATHRLVSRDHGMALYNVANVGLDQPNARLQQDILQPLEHAVEHFEEILKVHPDSYSDQRRLLLCRQLQAEAHPNVDIAAEKATVAAGEMLQLINENPQVPALLAEWIQLRILAGRLHVEVGRNQQAADVFEQTLAEIAVRAGRNEDNFRVEQLILAAEHALCLARDGDPKAGAKLQSVLSEMERTTESGSDHADLEDLELQIRQALDSTAN